MLIDLPFEQALAASVLAWIGLGLGTGIFVHRLPVQWLSRDNWLTRPRAFEDGGRFYERVLRIRSWKDKLPEKGDFFPGGFSKRAITERSDEFLERFAAETRRAELVHWMNAASGPIFLLWCPWPLGVVMVCFGWAGHMPFVCIQRYNRARIERTLHRRQRRAERAGHRDHDPSTPSTPSIAPTICDRSLTIAPIATTGRTPRIAEPVDDECADDAEHSAAS